MRSLGKEKRIRSLDVLAWPERVHSKQTLGQGPDRGCCARSARGLRWTLGLRRRGGATVQYANHLQSFSKAGKFWQRVLTAPGSLNIEPPPKIPSILPTLRPLFRPFFLGAERLLYMFDFLFQSVLSQCITHLLRLPVFASPSSCFCFPVSRCISDYANDIYERPRTVSKM